MTDEQLQKSRLDGALADRLVDAVQYSSTSGGIYAGVGRAFGRPPFVERLRSLFRKNK